MNPVMYILVQKDHGMSAGKMAAQCAHAAVEAYRLSLKPSNPSEPGIVQETALANLWRRGGHYSKIILQCDDLGIAQKYIEKRGFWTELIIDEGRTEFDRLTPTALGVAIVDKDWPHARETFSAFKLYNDKRDKRVSDEEYERLRKKFSEPMPDIQAIIDRKPLPPGITGKAVVGPPRRPKPDPIEKRATLAERVNRIFRSNP